MTKDAIQRLREAGKDAAYFRATGETVEAAVARLMKGGMANSAAKKKMRTESLAALERERQEEEDRIISFGEGLAIVQGRKP